ncbi:MAG: hypothetical protein QOI81_149 [Actinomycetota bacterium]|nr:hypothetical protein [Actinomycetota bacterium]
MAVQGRAGVWHGHSPRRQSGVSNPKSHGKMPPMEPLVLKTPRLRLRPFARDFSDLEALNAIQADPDHMRFYPHPFSIDDTRGWIQRWLDHEDRYGYALLAVEDAATGEFLGNVGFAHQVVDGIDELEIGWSITPARARQGIATEAAAACRDWAFAYLDVDHVISLVRPENEPSAGVARNLGMTVWKETPFGSLGWTHRVYRIDRPTA